MDEFVKWFPAGNKVAHPKRRLLCFPGSGARENVFTGKVRVDGKMRPNTLMQWADSEQVEILAVELPGRARRHNEPFAQSLREVAEALLPILRPRLEDIQVPYAVVGHSMGCWAAYEFLICVQNSALPPPTALCVACFAAPDLRLDERPWRQSRPLDEAEFQAECRSWDINPSVFRAGIWEAFQPMLRADFQLFDEYEHEHEEQGVCSARLQCPIVGYVARDDRYISRQLVEGWMRFSDVSFTMAPEIEGHHLFVFDDDLKQAWFRDLSTVVPVETPDAPTAGQGEVPPTLPPAGASTETDPPMSGPAEVRPLSVAGPPRPRSNRILCLHGMGTCGEILNRQTAALQKHARAAGMEYDWEFVNSPAPVDWDSTSMQARLVTTYFPDCANLSWARRIDRNDPSKATVSSGQSEVAGAGTDQVYCDWEGPLSFLLEHIRTNGPYDGVLGFSQGANMACLLSAISESGVMPWLRFRFAVLICSSRYSWCDEFLTVKPLRTALPAHLFEDGAEGDLPLIAGGSSGAEATLNTPSLHIIASMDPLRVASESMAELFVGARCESFSNTHKPPNQKAAGAALADFVAEVHAQ